VAERLGNTSAICRKCYIHPRVIERYLREGLPAIAAPNPPRGGGIPLMAVEAAVLRLLRDGNGDLVATLRRAAGSARRRRRRDAVGAISR